MPIDTCPDCGKELTAGLCPRCLLKLGIDDPGPDDHGATLDHAPRPGSVLATIAATLGGVPRVLLRDTDFGEEPSPLVRPVEEADSTLRYRIDGEIAQGGMGTVLRGRDPDLGRDVAIKVLRHDLRGNADMARRFVEEAQIGGQLQHPGVVPVYELGTFADRRPYFSMKLVKGKTLADLLAARPSPAGELPRFLAIFESIAQTMAYSHTRGVIHRDLKPSNVMVGSFGEVQVMDWGLAKVLARGGVVDDARAGKVPPPETLIATARSGSDSDLSHAGSVMGTPSYMAPEQARGETDRVDERADVFALGSILCEILTGAPAFTGRGSGEILRKAARGDTADALARLGSCGAEADLVALAGACLAVEPEDRPHDANVVADRITAYLAGVQERVQSALRERAVAVARAVEERRRRKVQLALAASVLAFTTLGGLSTTYYLQQRAERSRQRTERVAATDRVVGQAVTLRDQALAQPEDLARWQVALAAVGQAEAARDEGAAPRLLALRAEVQSGLDAAERDKALLDRLVDIRSAKADDPDGSITHHDYAEAFRVAGIDLTRLTPAEAGAKIRARPHAVAMAGALDDWAEIHWHDGADAVEPGHLRAAASVADPDPWRIRLRAVLAKAEKGDRITGLRELAKAADLAGRGAIGMHLLGKGLANSGDLAGAESVLRGAQRRHPRDVWINYELGAVLEKRSRGDEAIRFYTAARAIRPETAHELAHALELRGESDEALAIFRNLVELRPRNVRHLGCLGKGLQAKGLAREAREVFEAAAAVCRKAIALRPDDPDGFCFLGTALMELGKLDEAVAALRKAVELRPDIAEPYARLGIALGHQGKLDEAVAALRKSDEIRPDDVVVIGNLGATLRAQGKLDEAVAASRRAIELRPDVPDAHSNLGSALQAQGKLEEGVASLRKSIELKPDHYQGHARLGIALQAQGKPDEAIASLRKAVELRPDYDEALAELGALLCDVEHDYPAAEALFRRVIELQPGNAQAHFNLNNALRAQGKFDEAVAASRRAIELRPDFPEALHNLGTTLLEQGKVDKGDAAIRRVIELNPDHALAHCNLGLSLRERGDYAGSLALIRRGHELGSKQPGWAYPSARWLAEAEELVARAERLPMVLRGAEKPKDNAERLAFARICSNTQRPAAAARFFAEAFEADPGLVDDRRAQHRYHAACVAVLAAAGKGKDDPRPDDAARAGLRGQALAWLKSELSAWKRVSLTVEPGNKELVARTLAHWEQDPDLADVRGDTELAGLPEAERAGWRSLWAEVDTLRKRAGTTRAIEAKPAAAATARPAGAPVEAKPSAPTREPTAPASPKNAFGPGGDDGTDVIHRKAHELASTKPREAEPLFRRALEGYRKSQGPDGALTLDVTLDLANLLDATGRVAEAEPLLRAALETVRAHPQPDDPRPAMIQATLGLNLLQQRRWAEAEPLLREALAVREKLQPDDWRTLGTRSMLGGSLLGQKKYAEAEPLILSGYEGLKAREDRIPPPGRPRLAEAAERVVQLYEAWGKPEKAADWRARLSKPAVGPEPRP